MITLLEAQTLKKAGFPQHFGRGHKNGMEGIDSHGNIWGRHERLATEYAEFAVPNSDEMLAYLETEYALTDIEIEKAGKLWSISSFDRPSLNWVSAPTLESALVKFICKLGR